MKNLRYTIILEKSANGYGAYVPDLPGCIAVGRTRVQTRRLIQGAIELHLKGMREDGEPIPRPTTVFEYVEVHAA